VMDAGNGTATSNSPWPGLTRPSNFSVAALRAAMDGRLKAAQS
jgi:hypothetical protein